MTRRIAVSVLMIGLVASLVGLGTAALFTDTETSAGNTFTAGTLNLEAGGFGTQPMTIVVANMKPGDKTPNYRWVLRNTGTLPGRVSVTFSPMINRENGVNRPEVRAGDDPNSLVGELGQYLKTGKEGVCLRDDVTVMECNHQAGFCIVMVDEEIDTGGTIGWGPVGWTVPSRLFSVWGTGPPNPWGTPGINGLGGRTFDTLGQLPHNVLLPGQQVQFNLRASLDQNLRTWTGTTWIEVDDNLIQGDSVEFDITFRLDQVN